MDGIGLLLRLPYRQKAVAGSHTGGLGNISRDTLVSVGPDD